jgi:H+/Cl- antiporter ClcA
MFLKMLAWSLSQSCGFVGGIMFPFFFVGAAAGNVAAQWTGVNQSFATVVLLFAVPGAMCPLPFTFLAMGAFLFECSSYQTGAIFVAMLAAHAVTTGSSVLHRLVGAPTLGAWADEAPGWRDPHSYATRSGHARGVEAGPAGELKTA